MKELVQSPRRPGLTITHWCMCRYTLARLSPGLHKASVTWPRSHGLGHIAVMRLQRLPPRRARVLHLRQSVPPARQWPAAHPLRRTTGPDAARPDAARLGSTWPGLTRPGLVWRAHSSLSKKKLPVLDNYWLAAFFIERQKISTANIDISTNIFDEIKIKTIK